MFLIDALNIRIMPSLVVRRALYVPPSRVRVTPNSLLYFGCSNTNSVPTNGSGRSL